MGFFDVLTGKTRIKKPAPDRLFAMATAGVTLEGELGLKSAGRAAIVFQPLGTADFDAIVADMEELVVGVNAVSSALESGGYGERVLCAVFAFRDAQDRPVYWIYNYKRGAFYPFVPAGGQQQRDSERELRLQAQIGAELPVEAELERWFPLWDIPI